MFLSPDVDKNTHSWTLHLVLVTFGPIAFSVHKVRYLCYCRHNIFPLLLFTLYSSILLPKQFILSELLACFECIKYLPTEECFSSFKELLMRKCLLSINNIFANYFFFGKPTIFFYLIFLENLPIFPTSFSWETHQFFLPHFFWETHQFFYLIFLESHQFFLPLFFWKPTNFSYLIFLGNPLIFLPHFLGKPTNFSYLMFLENPPIWLMKLLKKLHLMRFLATISVIIWNFCKLFTMKEGTFDTYKTTPPLLSYLIRVLRISLTQIPRNLTGSET